MSSTSPSVPDRVDMILAFTLQVVGMVFDADGELRPEEREFWDALVRQPVFTERGLVVKGACTARFEELRMAALTSLGPMLSKEDKLAIVETLVRAAACDGEADPREVECVVSGMGLIGVTRKECFALIRELGERETLA